MPRNPAREPAASAAHSPIQPVTAALLAIVHETMPHPPKRPYSAESYVPAHLLELAVDALRSVGVEVETGPAAAVRAADDDDQAPVALRAAVRSSDLYTTSHASYSAAPLVLNPRASDADLVALALARATKLVELGRFVSARDAGEEFVVAELMTGPAEDVVVVLEELAERGTAEQRST